MLINKIIIFLKKYLTHHIVFLNIMVFQNGDTLIFRKGSDIIEQWIMSSETIESELVTSIHTTRSMTADDNKHFLFYEEWYFPASDSYCTQLIFYNADKKKIWERTENTGRRISFYLSKIYGDDVALVTTDHNKCQPILYLIRDKKADKIADQTKWHRLADYAFSPNMKYLALHVKNPYMKKMWDYIHFIDLKNKEEWSYVFPICVSCKRDKIDVMVNNQGITEVIYKNEHRIFSKQGRLTDIFIVP
jgi:hypothetical protein